MKSKGVRFVQWLGVGGARRAARTDDEGAELHAGHVPARPDRRVQPGVHRRRRRGCRERVRLHRLRVVRGGRQQRRDAALPARGSSGSPATPSPATSGCSRGLPRGCSSRSPRRSAPTSPARPFSPRRRRSTTGPATASRRRRTWGRRPTSNCFAFIQRQGGAWKRAFPASGVGLQPADPRVARHAEEFFAYTVIGIVIGAAYAIAASGLVLTYATSRVFNIAHGAVGMVMAFGYWEVAVNHGLPQWLAPAHRAASSRPLFGAVIERVMMRGLTEAPVSVSLVVTVGLLVGLLGAAQTIWPPGRAQVEEFFTPHGARPSARSRHGHQMLTVVIAILVAAGSTSSSTGPAPASRCGPSSTPRAGRAARRRPDRLDAVLGRRLVARRAGRHPARRRRLDYFALTLLVISAYAAAMLGRLKSLPLTFVGAIGCSASRSPTSSATCRRPAGSGSACEPSVPVILLFAILLFLPQVQLRVGQIRGIRAVPLPSSGAAVVARDRPSSSPGSSTGAMSVGQRQPSRPRRSCFALLMLSLRAAHRLRRLRLARPVHVRRHRRARRRPDRHGSPFALLVAAADLGGRRRAGRAAAPAAARSLPRPRHARHSPTLMDQLIFQAELRFGYNGVLPVKRVSLARHPARHASGRTPSRRPSS